MLSVELELPHAFTNVSEALTGYRQLGTETFFEEVLSVKLNSGVDRPLSVSLLERTDDCPGTTGSWLL